MEYNRREFVAAASKYTAPVLVGAAFLGGRILYQRNARAALRTEMIGTAIPVLAEKSLQELNEYPSAARNEIRDYFHGACLNVHDFAEEVCSIGFVEKLGACSTEEGKHRLLDLAFGQKVLTGVEVVNRVELIAKEMGTRLDANWNVCCKRMAESWNVALHKRDSTREMGELAAKTEPMILASLQQARDQAYPLGQRPSLGATFKQIGESAIRLLPVAIAEPKVAFPIFVVRALSHLWDWLVGWLSHPQAAIQEAVSTQLALLANRVGAEFEREMRKRIADLQQWQEGAIHDVAVRTADSTIGLLV